jgi:hypothetical protein
MTTLRRLTRAQVLAFRQDGHGLGQRQPAEALHAVAGACGVRNTPPGSAALALSARLRDLAPAALDRALAVDKTLVEVLGPRISPHVVPTADAAVFTLGALPADEASLRASLAPLAPALDAAGLTASAALEQAVDAARAALDGGALSRGALSAALTRQLPAALCPDCRACKTAHVQESLFRLVGVAGAYVLTRGAGGDRYVRTDRWLGAWPDGAGAAARGELLRRYLRCFGPSTASHFAAWAGLGSADAQRSWDAIADQLVPVELDRRRAWLHAADLARLQSPPPATGVRLLPPYDAYLDQRDRATLLPDKAFQRRVWRIIGNPGVVLAAGEIVGVWRPQKKGRRLLLSVEPFTPLPMPVRAEVEAEAALLAPYRGCTSAAVTFAD